MTTQRETAGHMSTTDRILFKLSVMMLGRAEGRTKKDGTKRPAIKGTDDVRDMAMLSNAYGYLLNIHTNVKKIVDIYARLKDLEALAMRTERLMPDVRRTEDKPQTR